jgi:hypothetical protein
MIRWIRRIAFGIGVGTFFALFAVGIVAAGSWSWEALLPIGIRAIAGAGCIWITGFITADILVKGISADLPRQSGDAAESGLIRRFISAESGPALPRGGASAQSADGRKAERPAL